jgi:hypothetical protein
MYSINNSYQRFASKNAGFDDIPDRDYLIDDEWRPAPVAKRILGLSESKRFAADDVFSDIFDEYASIEADRIADASKMQRWDDAPNIASDYAQALSERTRYSSTKADEEEYEKNKLIMAAKLDKTRRRYPQRISMTAHYTDATFDEDVQDSAPLYRGNQRPGMSRLPSMYGNCGVAYSNDLNKPYGGNFPYSPNETAFSPTPNLPRMPRSILRAPDSINLGGGDRRLPTAFGRSPEKCSVQPGRVRVANGSKSGITRKGWY